jgi:hypothetical protein
MDARIKTWAPWIVAATCLLLVPCAFCAGWSIPTWRTPNVEAPSPGGDKPNAKPISKPREEWGFQDIQDHLAKKGMKTSRGLGRFVDKAGMWFVPGDGKPITLQQMSLLEVGHQDESDFFMEDHGTPDGAKKRVRELLNIHQEQADAWRKYVIFGTPAKRAELKKLLP